MDNIKYAIEGILFAAGEPVKAAKLAVVLDTEKSGLTMCPPVITCFRRPACPMN